ncbi:MAG: hypothetical protein FWG70_12255 [Oscillospiraceae bacterium]|nr:hypothetical protein [Oscillospiraceae bacterium]
MSGLENKIKLFEGKQVRHIWDEESQKYLFSVVDIIEVLTDSDNPRRYWSDLKRKLQAEGSQLYENIVQLKIEAPDGKMRLTDVADTEQVLRLVQSVPSKKAEPFKLWLAKVGNMYIDEAVDPELSIERAVQNYRRLGYSENWINQRIKSIEVRKALTDEWKISGVEEGEEYAALTDLMSRTWSGMTTREYKNYKGLRKENLRDNMTNMELILNMFAEAAATEISMVEQPTGFAESAEVAKRGANTAKVAREQLEAETGKPAVSRLNAKNIGTRQLRITSE